MGMCIYVDGHLIEESIVYSHLNYREQEFIFSLNSCFKFKGQAKSCFDSWQKYSNNPAIYKLQLIIYYHACCIQDIKGNILVELDVNSPTPSLFCHV